jgi:asparagine synthase (glutamine-hydrolysing)
MCGIAGFVGEIAQSEDALNVLERMTESISHRGPDGSSCWVGPNVGLGHRRLAIIDPEGGKQPLWDSTGRYVITFNGEIYNYPELERELEAKGYVFRTRSDTEAIHAVIEAWGIDEGLRRLRGMFALALYDTKDQSLLLARDRVGIKPLYWAMTPKGILFGSEQKALLASRLVSRRVNPVAIHDFLAQGYPTTPSTCWADISLLEPGTWMRISNEGIKSGRFWEWTARENTALSIEEATERTREKMLDALRGHLLSDVPLGVFLSGGLDSSLIVALLSQGLAPGIQTFNMGFGDPAYDESDYARRIAEHCKTDHHESRMENDAADVELLQRILNQYDEPFGDISCIPVYLICQKIRQHVKVVLSGDGGDEVLGGYLRYLYARRLTSLSRFRSVMPLFNPAMPFVEQRMGRQGQRVVKAGRLAQMPREEMLCALHASFSEEERNEMYNPEFARLAQKDGPTSSRFARFIPQDLTDPIQQLIAAEMRLRLHADYLRKVDIASSAHGLEVRVPFLDNEMLDLAGELPVNFKIAPDGETKIISRRLVKSLLPAEIAEKRKQGFDLPLDRWMGTATREFLRELLLDPAARISEWINPRGVERIFNSFQNSTTDNLSRDVRSQRVFMLASLELWLRKWNPGLH